MPTKTPNWPKEYLRAIQEGREVVSDKVRKVYERECAWMDDPPEDFPYVFRPSVGQRHIDFIETFCKHSKGGKFAGRLMRLELFQKAKLQLVFGWVERDTGLRRFREVIDVRGRKCGKSTETAAVALDMLFNDHEPGAEIYCTANKKDQASIIFNEIVHMRAQSPAIRACCKKRQGDVYCPSTFGVIKALAADSSTMDGLNAHFFVLDEWHAAKDSKVYDVMKQSQVARDQPLAWLISTNGFVREGFYDQIYTLASHIARWDDGFHDFRTLPLLYELDAKEEWKDPACWAKANPGLGHIKKVALLEDNVERAKRDPGYLPTVLTKDFNVPENASQAWLPYDYAVNETVLGDAAYEHSYGIGGCDLSSTTDLTCSTILIRRPQDPRYYVVQKYFLPEARIAAVEQTQGSEAPYRLWAEQGWLEICPGAAVDYHAVTLWFSDMSRRRDIRPLWIGYDAALSGYWAPEMTEYGFDMEKIRQGPFTWTYAMKQMAAAFEEHLVIYENNPMLRWCLLNTAAKSLNREGIETIQPVKCASNARIDGMVSLLNAWTCMNNHIDDYTRFLR